MECFKNINGEEKSVKAPVLKASVAALPRRWLPSGRVFGFRLIPAFTAVVVLKRGLKFASVLHRANLLHSRQKILAEARSF